MITIFDLVKPFPKKLKIEKSKNIGCYFNYKRYVNISTLCKNLLELNDNSLFEALTVFSNNHYKYRNTLYYNLQDLTIVENYEKRLLGSYTLSRDLNEVSYQSFDDIYHELLHIASSQLDKIKDILYSGFSYYDGKSNKSIGEGITDGYIELLCDRDLHDGRFIHKVDEVNKNYSVDYCYAKVLARQLEIVVGKDLLEDMFFKNGFIRLKEFLMKYKDEKAVNNFFKNCDIAAIADNYRNPLLNKKVLEAQQFLMDIIEEYMPDKKEAIQKEKMFYSNKFRTYLTNEVMKEEVKEFKERARAK